MNRLLQSVWDRINLVIGRAILKVVQNDGKTQRLQVVLLADEGIDHVERLQNYGFESYPETESEAAVAFLAGDRSHGVALCVHDRRYRPDYMTTGDACMYTRQDKTAPHREHLKDSQETNRQMNLETINARQERQITTPKTTHVGDYYITGNLYVTGNIISSGGNIIASTGNVGAPAGDVYDKVRTMAGDRIIYNGHVHPEVFIMPVRFEAANTLITEQKQ